jgi:Outer membrane protein beta-barrel domain
MRTRMVALLSTLALAVPAYAGAQSVLKTSFGFVGAVNMSTFGGSDASGAKNKVSFSLGGFARVPMGPMWSFQPELEYAGKGAKEDFAGGTGTVDLSYIEVPLLFRVASPSSPAGQLYGEFGPAVAVKIDCTISGTSGGVTVSGSCSSNNVDLKSSDFGGVVGAGYEFPLSGMGLSIGVRYNYGFSELVSGSNAKNRNLQFVAGLRL